jgi:hypothetical protein
MTGQIRNNIYTTVCTTRLQCTYGLATLEWLVTGSIAIVYINGPKT